MADEWVKFSSDNPLGECPGFLTGTSAASSAKGVVVLQAWWGVDEETQAKASDIAKRGRFLALVPDLYRGKVAKNREEAGHLSSGLDWQGAVQDIRAAARFLMETRGCAKVGVTGFCMGGALSVAAAALGVPEISAAAPFYGIPKVEDIGFDLKNIRVPLQCHFGKFDDAVGFSTPVEYNRFRGELTSLGKDFEFYEYDAGHAFTTAYHRNYNKAISDLALNRMAEFMNKHL